MMNNMKQLHKHQRRDEEMQPNNQTPPYSPRSLRHPSSSRSLHRSINYIFREQRFLFIIIGIVIGSTFFIFQPSLSTTTTTTTTNTIKSREFPSIPTPISIPQRENTALPRRAVNHGAAERVPVSISQRRRRTVVTGGAGFVGSHLVDRLVARGDEVIVVDNFFTGRKENVLHHMENPRFELIRRDVVQPILLEVDQIYHLACPASPVYYNLKYLNCLLNLYDYKTNVMGTLNMLGLAKRIKARFLITSTSEVYGDPLEHPQKETYWGHVNPIGVPLRVRSCYDEGKRTAETLTMDYHRNEGVEVRIARIFNTYGPRMCLEDGRVVSNFVSQAIRKQPMTVYGDGKQTRSFQYVSDLVDGLMALMEGDHIGPFNLGNPGEFTMLELAQVVKETIDPNASIEFKENTADDPQKRKPDISKAKELLNWEPKVTLREGLPRMASDFRERILKEVEGAFDK
ncbi:hypothetical protein LXL04_032730 [Taraxacum kok-saghyz]